MKRTAETKFFKKMNPQLAYTTGSFYRQHGIDRTNFINRHLNYHFEEGLAIIETKEFKLFCKDEALTVTKAIISFHLDKPNIMEILFKRIYSKWDYKHNQKAIAHLLQALMKRNDMEKVKQVIEYMLPIEIRDPHSHLNALGMAAAHGTPEMIEMLVTKYKMDVNCKLPGGSYIIHLAAAKADNFLKLAELGADTMARSKQGKLPLFYALRHAQTAVIAYYLRHPKRPKKVSRQGLGMLLWNDNCSEEALQLVLDNLCNHVRWSTEYWADLLTLALRPFRKISLPVIQLLIRAMIQKSNPPLAVGTSIPPPIPLSLIQSDMTQPLRALSETQDELGKFVVQFPYLSTQVSLKYSVLLSEAEHQRLREVMPPSQVIQKVITYIGDVELFHLIAHCWSLTRKELADSYIIHRRLQALGWWHAITIHLMQMLPINIQNEQGLYEVECANHSSLGYYLAAGLKPYLIRDEKAILRAIPSVHNHHTVKDDWVSHGMEINCEEFRYNFRATDRPIEKESYFFVKLRYNGKEKGYVVKSIHTVRSILNYRHNLHPTTYSLKFYSEQRILLGEPSSAKEWENTRLIEVELRTYFSNKQLKSLCSFIDVTVVLQRQ